MKNKNKGCFQMTIRDMEKYYNEKGEVGVLISPGWGASWSTWYDNYAIAFDKRIIEYWLHNNPSENEMKYFLNSIGYTNVYMGDYNQLTLVFVPKGQMFCIHEYDGNESIETPETMGMIVID